MEEKMSKPLDNLSGAAVRGEVVLEWDYKTMGLPNEEVIEMWRTSGHSGTIPWAFVNRIQERFQAQSISPRAADALDIQPTDQPCAECGLSCKPGNCCYNQNQAPESIADDARFLKLLDDIFSDTDLSSDKVQRYTNLIVDAVDECRASSAPVAPIAPDGWISVKDRLPEVGTWCNILVDRSLGDFWDRQNKPLKEVYGVQLREVDSEGYAHWQRWKMADGGPMGSQYLVSHWMPLPPVPQQEGSEAGNG